MVVHNKYALKRQGGRKRPLYVNPRHPRRHTKQQGPKEGGPGHKGIWVQGEIGATAKHGVRPTPPQEASPSCRGRTWNPQPTPHLLRRRAPPPRRPSNLCTHLKRKLGDDPVHGNPSDLLRTCLQSGRRGEHGTPTVKPPQPTDPWN